MAGGSKRGWTTWTTAAVDKRVVAIVPIVIDVLNIEPSFIHHWEAYGFYAPAVADYEAAGIMEWQGTREYRNLMKIEEPYQYRDPLTVPKLLINATGDQFFLPDSSQYYFDDLRGSKFLRYVPNADHSLKESDAFETLTAWYDAFLRGDRMPSLAWRQERDGSIHVTARDHPSAVKLWQASNPNARDFRLETIGKAWTSSALTEGDPGVYVGRVSAPAKGWTAFFVEMTYNVPDRPAPLKLTTSVYVLPDVVPYNFKTRKATSSRGE